MAHARRALLTSVTLCALGGAVGAQGLTNNHCVSATSILGEGVFAFDNTNATTDGPTAPCSVAPDMQIEGDLWYAWSATFTGAAQVSTCGLSALDTMLAVYGACPPSTLIACNDDSCAFQSELTFFAEEGEAYRLRVGTYPGSARGAGQFSIEDVADFTPCGNPGGADVVVGELTDLIHWGSAGPINGYSFGATACNVGDATMPWEGPTNHHPVIAQHLVRVADGGIEQVGLSWLKHGFASATETACCGCQNPGNNQIMGIGCADTYSAGINGSQGGSGSTGGLGPRSGVNPWTGVFPFPYATQGQSGDNAYKRLQVHSDDLDPAQNPGAAYFGEVQYITPDEGAGKRLNNVSYRGVAVLGPALGGWGLGFSGASVRERPVIYAWQDVFPDVRIEPVDVPSDGRVYVASRVTDNGDGTWRYRYAVQNVNAYRAVRSLEVPLPAGASASGFAFSDVDYHSGEAFDGTDWTATRGSGGIGGPSVSFSTVTFAQNQNANALRFGTLYSFGFDADRPPGEGFVTLGLFRTGTPPSASANAWVPVASASFCDAGDGALAACPCQNPGAPDTGCDLQQATGGVRLDVARQVSLPTNRATLTGTGYPALAAPGTLVIRAGALDPSAPIVFGDGLRCVGVPLVRLAGTFAGAGVSTHAFGHGTAAGGGTFFYQLWFRNTPVLYCDPTAGFNLSNGRSLTW